MKIDEIRSTISDLMGVEPKSFGNDVQAKEAAEWILISKKTEDEIDATLDPEIKEAFTEHRRLTTQKKSILEKLISAKARVRVNLANWIAGGHDVKGCYIKTSYKVTVTNADEVPDEYAFRAINEEMIKNWVSQTEGKVPVPGCTIEPVNVLYARETSDAK